MAKTLDDAAEVVAVALVDTVEMLVAKAVRAGMTDVVQIRAQVLVWMRQLCGEN